MRKVKSWVRHVLMRTGMFAERCWDEIKKFVWWIFAPDAYADLAYDYRALKRGYDELMHTWNVDVEHCYREIDALKAENEKLKAENEELKTENHKRYKQLEEIIDRYELAEAEERPFVLLPHLAEL
ncbi:MAG: hypothetical protein IIZ42_00085 [Eubacterium sp.]|nr:hypothetical protein [Eubacterium sp.]